jgi:hypothetical protein
MNTTHPFVGTQRVTETASPTPDVTVQVLGDQESARDRRPAVAAVTAF